MNYLTDEQVEQEIERLRNSPYVALARKEQYVRCQRTESWYPMTGAVSYMTRRTRERRSR